MKKISIIIFLVLFLGIFFKVNAQSGTGGDFTGWLWAGSYYDLGSLCGSSLVDCGNAGWGSLSSTNSYDNLNPDGSPVDTSPLPYYGLDFPDTDGPVIGRAWMSNLGWIDFNPAGPFPVSGCNPACPTTSVQRVGNDLYGWARVVGVGDSSSFQADPNNPTLIDNSGGYDGWIKMSGTASDGTTYKVYYDPANDALLGNAWSSDIGWISFNGKGVYIPPVYNNASLESGVLDTCSSGVDCGSSLNSFMWKGSLNGGIVRFQIASSDAVDGPWNFYGPSANASDYYYPSPDVPMKVTSEHLNKRYFKYKIFLDSCTPNCSGSVTTPNVTDVILNWSE